MSRGSVAVFVRMAFDQRGYAYVHKHRHARRVAVSNSEFDGFSVFRDREGLSRSAVNPSLRT